MRCAAPQQGAPAAFEAILSERPDPTPVRQAVPVVAYFDGLLAAVGRRNGAGQGMAAREGRSSWRGAYRGAG